MNLMWWFSVSVFTVKFRMLPPFGLIQSQPQIANWNWEDDVKSAFYMLCWANMDGGDPFKNLIRNVHSLHIPSINNYNLMDETFNSNFRHSTLFISVINNYSQFSSCITHINFHHYHLKWWKEWTGHEEKLKKILKKQHNIALLVCDSSSFKIFLFSWSCDGTVLCLL